MQRKLLLVTSAMSAVLCLCGPVWAAETADADAPVATNTEGTVVESVTVQVNKRNEDVQDAPAAVTAFTPTQRDDLGVISIFDMTRATPSFEYSSAIDRAFIRGIGRNTNAPGTQAGVALYIDGVYTPLSYGLDRAPILSGTMETDSGPQGTLFGRNAIGGVIQQTTAHATDHFEVRTDLRYGDHNRIDVAATVGGPVGDYLRVLVGANVRKQTEGYFNNLYLHKDAGGPTDEALYVGVVDYKFGNFDGFWKIEANTYDRKLSQFSQYGATFTALSPYYNDYTYTNQIGVTANFNCATVDPTTAGNPLTIRALVNCPANVAQAVSYYDPTNVTALNPYQIKTDYRTNFKGHNNWDTAFQGTWHLPFFDLKYIGGYNQYVYNNHQDYDATARGAWQVDPDGPANALPAVTIQPTLYNYYENRKWSSHELNFISNNTENLSWIFGLYYYQDDFLNTTHVNAPGQTELATVLNPFTFKPAALDNSDLSYFKTSGHAFTKSYATFGQVDYKLTDKWTLTGGLRWNRDTVQATEEDHYISWVPGVTAGYNASTGKYGPAIDYTAFLVPGSCTPANVPAITASGARCTFDPALNSRTISDDWDGWGGVMNVSYKPNDDSLVYAKYSRGYKAGGIAISGAMSVQPVMKPENLNAYELGYKFSPGRKLFVNTALFYYDYRNYQDFGSIPNTNPGATSGLISVGFNVPKARNIGLEVTGAWHPTHAFTLTFSGNYMDAKVTDGGTVSLPDTLDPGATGTVKLQQQDGSVQTLTYTPQPCGAPIIAAGVSYQPQCITGDVLKGSSPWKIWISPQYRFDFANGSLDLVGNFSMRAGNVSSYSQSPLYVARDYNSVDFRAIWQPTGGRYKVIGFVNNIFDKVGSEFVLAGRTSLGNNYVQNVLTIPRTWGVEVQAKF